MPTIYDRYTIKWDGNSLSCDNAVILGYNGKNTTILTFENTSPYEDVRFINVEFYGKGHTIVRGFENNAIETSLSPERYGHDAIMSLYWERDSGDHGVSRMGVIIERSEYFHDEETEQQADDNTQEINLLKARVASLEDQLSNIYGQPEFSSSYQYDIGVSTSDLLLSKDDHPELFERLGAGNGPGASFIAIEGFPSGAGTQNIGISLLNADRGEVYFQKTVTYTSDGAPASLLLSIDRVTGEGSYNWLSSRTIDPLPSNFFEFSNGQYGGTGYNRPQDFENVTEIRIVSSFDLAESKITTFHSQIKGV